MQVFWTRSQNREKRLTASSCLSVRPSVRPSVRMEQLGSHWMDFHEILYLMVSRNSVNFMKTRAVINSFGLSVS
jgi:hypothetical protein